jgi:uncharacterized protein YjbI with pentapeptide repeats
MGEMLSDKEINEILSSPVGKVIDFSKIESITFPRADIIDCKITGEAHGPEHLFGKGNIINCDLQGFSTISVDFDYVDFKDCNIKESKFTNASFDFGAIINNVFNDCIFEKGHFRNMSVTESKFSHVKFIDCDLKDMIIKGCTFHNCAFINCETSNKLIEASTLFNCLFQKTDIQLETITENFGLTDQSIIDSQIRDRRLREKHVYLTFDELTKKLAQSETSPFSRLRIAYFLNSQIFITGDPIIDETFLIENWLKLCKIPSAFTNLLGLYLEFVLFEYERNNLPGFVILKFHDMTSKLVNQLALQHDLYKSVMGVHMTLSRLVETFLLLLYENANQVKKNVFALKVIGPLEVDYYKGELEYFLHPTGIEIDAVRKANSPNILTFVWQNLEAVVILISLLFSTRLKIELSRYYPSEKDRGISEKNMALLPLPVPEIKSEGSVKPEELQLFNIDLGLAKIDQKHLYSIKLRSIMPGNLLTTLKLDVSTKFIGKVRDIIVDLIK